MKQIEISKEKNSYIEDGIGITFNNVNEYITIKLDIKLFKDVIISISDDKSKVNLSLSNTDLTIGENKENPKNKQYLINSNQSIRELPKPPELQISTDIYHGKGSELPELPEGGRIKWSFFS